MAKKKIEKPETVVEETTTVEATAETTTETVVEETNEAKIATESGYSIVIGTGKHKNVIKGEEYEVTNEIAGHLVKAGFATLKK